jgi:hypothetical protein
MLLYEAETNINSSRNGGEGQEVRRDTFTGGAEHRAPETTKERTKPARRTLLDFIFIRDRI